MPFDGLRWLVVAGLMSGTTARSAVVEKKDDKKWQASIPRVAAEGETWRSLIPEMVDRGMFYGALFGSRIMLNFFQDLPSKELAYKTIVQMIDLGYPGISRPLFVPGDIEPDGNTNFGKSYFFYKALTDIDKKMNRWAQVQFEKVDKKFFPKYIFYQAVQAYRGGHLDDAIGYLKKALVLTTSKEYRSLASREARTLARIYYEQSEFEKSLEIYNTFLLKLNPVEASDWLEAGWNLYRLKRYPEALGYTYNFESAASGKTIFLEPYILRALIYREYCLIKNVETMSKDFEKRFGKVLEAIRLGEPLSILSMVDYVELPETFEYRQTLLAIDELTHEQIRIKSLPKNLRALAEYVYSSEKKMLSRKAQMLRNNAQESLARHFVILSESLKFLKFEVIRERYNPDNVFAQDRPPETVLVDETDEKSFRLHWTQWGDFWRDERLAYQGRMKSRCEK